jgi:hypothetical protein
MTETPEVRRGGLRWLVPPFLVAVAWFAGYILIQLLDLPMILFPLAIGFAAAAGVRYATGPRNSRPFAIVPWALSVLGSLIGWFVAEQIAIWVETRRRYNWGPEFFLILATLVAGLAVAGLLIGDRASKKAQEAEVIPTQSTTRT